MEIRYFDMEYSYKTHNKIIEISGGFRGVNVDKIGILESILTHIQNDIYYPTIEEKITHLVYAINKSHCFIDGNKRTSIALGAFLLELNGLDFLVNKFFIEMENICVLVADNYIEKELLCEIITSIIYDDEYSEELKIKIYKILFKKIK